MEQEENILGKEKIGKLIRKFSIPCIISMLVNSLYNIVDQIFIGQGVGYLGNGATNVVFPLVMIGLAFCANTIVELVLTEKWLPCVPFLQIFCITYKIYCVLSYDITEKIVSVMWHFQKHWSNYHTLAVVHISKRGLLLNKHNIVTKELADWISNS